MIRRFMIWLMFLGMLHGFPDPLDDEKLTKVFVDELSKNNAIDQNTTSPLTKQ